MPTDVSASAVDAIRVLQWLDSTANAKWINTILTSAYQFGASMQQTGEAVRRLNENLQASVFEHRILQLEITYDTNFDPT